MRCICRSSAGSEAKQGQKGCDPVELCDPPEFFRNPPELQAPTGELFPLTPSLELKLSREWADSVLGSRRSSQSAQRCCHFLSVS